MAREYGWIKNAIFSFIQDRLNNIVNRWTFKFITKGGGGKELIIKSVVIALQNHVTKKLMSPVAQFWWRFGRNTKKMH